jgi:hypothetical protein
VFIDIRGVGETKRIHHRACRIIFATGEFGHVVLPLYVGVGGGAHICVFFIFCFLYTLFSVIPAGYSKQKKKSTHKSVNADMTGRWSGSELRFLPAEAGGGGNCFFHTVAHIISLWVGQDLTMQDVRDELATTITKHTVRKFIAYVRADHRAFIPIGATDWNKVSFHHNRDRSAHQAQMLVRKPGPSFQGTDVCLRQLLCHSKFMRRNGVGALVLNTYGPGHTQIMHSHDSSSTQYYIVLFCDTNAHWRPSTIQPPGAPHPSSVLSTATVTRLLPLL